MFGRVTRDSIRQAAGRVRGHIQHAYSTARHWGSMLDQGVKIASKVYGAVQPALQDYAPQVRKARFEWCSCCEGRVRQYSGQAGE